MPSLPVPDVFTAVRSSSRGLTPAETAARQTRYGPNELPAVRHGPVWRRLVAQFTDLFAVVLLVSSAITFLAYVLERPHDPATLQLALAILGVVLLNAGIGFAQEYSAERTAESLQAMVPHTCRVLRDGERRELPVRDLVPGDVVILEAGDAVPADCRLVEAQEAAVNNAALTGESDPVARVAGPVPPGPQLSARNCVFMGTDLVAGTGKAVVFATGTATEFGRIFRLTAAAPRQQTPLQRQVAAMARRVAGVALATGAVMFAVRAPSGQPFVDTFVFSLGVMVALVPEGLPATLSVSLAIGVRRMARRHALVKQLLAVEALGSTSVICTDKTGTLTQAEMTVVQLWADGVSHTVSGVGYAPVGEITGAEPVRELLRAAALCGNARLVPPTGRDAWRVLGDTTEGALLVAALKAGLDPAEEEARTPRVSEYPFDSARKLMSTVHRDGLGTYLAYVKGAPLELLARCDTVERGTGNAPLTSTVRAEASAAADGMAEQGLRVLAVARRRVAGPRPPLADVESKLTLLGFAGMYDPPRPEVRDAVDACRRAGIRIVMVTGDHPLTAEAVARRVGIVREPSPATATGPQLDALDDRGLDDLLAGSTELLLCRVTPEHKMRVVTALQRRGEVVAVTGDGANDAPALKHADIGVAMGASGTDVAREAAVMVLLDDSFASITTAVGLGRSVYRNIRKFLIYLFSHNIAELVPIIAATFAGFPLVPITAVQILAIDLGSDVLPALALGAEPMEPDAMDSPPRPRNERLFSATVMGRICFLGGIQALGVCAVFFWHIHASGIPYADFTKDDPVYREAITMVQAGIVVSQFFNALAVRTDRQSVFRAGLLSNPWLIGAGCVGIALMAAISYAPPLQAVFHTAPLTAADWAVLTGFGVLLLIAEETRKWVLRHRRTSPEGGTR
ncbi:cation-transporting P-type ATPase [Streptomyces sp. Li-HN-5-11]|uniref:cation-translocating P-type ATPase n=1 Tax=Streptomyces sp. Li-HN-5-11 TaxID=3075432 RepID=UPI0028A583FC|nr:cation-transporting P-type ATPase [Streptomyces sp. Li-HN-5-11]WNM32122.1 cation-transporting P-type ATPase [Streptomyces sp. Li-HN-5-11]WOP39112.1 cation-transporting P-type ATPase [Streptomyces sp. Li-HN-5-13]